jgi:divalent metal cation (Fe/Co/Zn/Cd) transporter
MSVASNRFQMLRRGRALEIFTVLWTALEGIIGVVLGWLAGSVALIGFGADSFIEAGSGAILLWRLQAGREPDQDLAAEARAVRLVGASLVALAVYILYESASALIHQRTAEASIPGIVLSVIAMVVMPLLANAKRRVAAVLNSRALEADALQSMLCMYLSAILLGGLLLNAALGWWWADPVAALAMTPVIVREGIEAWREGD